MKNQMGIVQRRANLFPLEKMTEILAFFPGMDGTSGFWINTKTNSKRRILKGEQDICFGNRGFRLLFGE